MVCMGLLQLRTYFLSPYLALYVAVLLIYKWSGHIQNVATDI